MRILPPLLVVVLAAASGCGAPDEARVPISEGARAAPPPRLVATASFDDALASAAPDAARLGADAEALAARAEALRARADALAGPVVDPDERPRLDAAAAAGGA